MCIGHRSDPILICVPWPHAVTDYTVTDQSTSLTSRLRQQPCLERKSLCSSHKACKYTQKLLNSVQCFIVLTVAFTAAPLATGVRTRANLGGNCRSPGRSQEAICWWRGMGVILQIIKQGNKITPSNWF